MTSVAIFTEWFYGRPCEAAQCHEKEVEKLGCEICFAISLAAIMPELTTAAKKFGGR